MIEGLANADEHKIIITADPNTLLYVLKCAIPRYLLFVLLAVS